MAAFIRRVCNTRGCHLRKHYQNKLSRETRHDKARSRKSRGATRAAQSISSIKLQLLVRHSRAFLLMLPGARHEWQDPVPVLERQASPPVIFAAQSWGSEQFQVAFVSAPDETERMCLVLQSRRQSRICSSLISALRLLTPLSRLGDSISEGTIVQWCKSVGDEVAEDEVIAVVETDKVSVDVRSTHVGVIVKVFAAEDDVVSKSFIARCTTGSSSGRSELTLVAVDEVMWASLSLS